LVRQGDKKTEALASDVDLWPSFLWLRTTSFLDHQASTALCVAAVDVTAEGDFLVSAVTLAAPLLVTNVFEHGQATELLSLEIKASH